MIRKSLKISLPLLWSRTCFKDFYETDENLNSSVQKTKQVASP